MKFISLFTGIGGFDLGFERAGMTCVAQVENNAHAITQLQHHWPDVTRLEDVTHVGKHNLPPAELVCGGFPCQDVSVAGKRAGLAGERSGLWFEFRRILAEVTPRWVVIENVPGLLSSNGGRDFATILHGLAELRYRVCWRVLDAQYFGVAQRRRRLFIVGYLGDGRAAEVLFERESGAWDTAPSRKQSQASSADAEDGAGNSLTHWDTQRRRIYDAAGTAPNLSSEEGRGQGVPMVAQAIDVRNLRTNGDLSTPIQSKPNGGQSLNYINPVMAFDWHASSNGDTSVRGKGRSSIVRKEEYAQIRGSAIDAIAIQHAAIGRKDSAGPQAKGWRDDGATWTLDGRGDADAVAYAAAFTERTRIDGRNLETQEELAYALTNPGSGGRTHSRQIVTPYAVRRLTPVECERLQGFPDGWTTGSDSARYQRLGNAVCVNVAEWIGRRIMAAEGIPS